MRSIRLVAGASSPVPSTGYETKANVEKHECSLLKVVSDAGSTPAASTISSTNIDDQIRACRLETLFTACEGVGKLN